MQDIDKIIRCIALENGAQLVGVAATAEVEGETTAAPTFIPGRPQIARWGTPILSAELKVFPRAVVIGVPVLRSVLDTLKDGPNHIYYHHYRQINLLLDQVALKIGLYLEKAGYKSIPIAASQIVDWESQRAYVSHKELARLAGLGWRGRNNLLVTEKWGAAVRLASILTDAPLATGLPLDRDCGNCYACVRVCPAGAIKRDVSRFDHLACFQELRQLSRERNIGQYICGLCIKACYRGGGCGQS
ncbi:MAG: epoxyqueuosine reductase [Clostridia bacterium]|nr:epoxyqueuosine reductase [Clostridia bacterium]